MTKWREGKSANARGKYIVAFSLAKSRPFQYVAVEATGEISREQSKTAEKKNIDLGRETFLNNNCQNPLANAVYLEIVGSAAKSFHQIWVGEEGLLSLDYIRFMAKLNISFESADEFHIRTSFSAFHLFQLCKKTEDKTNIFSVMNSTNQTQSDESNFIQILVTAKAVLYFVNFIFITAMGILIIKTVRQNSSMKKEIRHILLCHHLLCSSLSCCFGTMLNAVQNAKVQTFWMWIIFGVQTAAGESVLITLALMALNTCLAVCKPLRYFALVHSLKNKVIVSIWVGTMLKALCLIMIERTENNPMNIYKAEASCPTLLGGKFATISGIVLMSLLGATITISYFFLYREGKITGHFNHSNKKARKTIIIHVLQMSFHILPPLIITAVGKGTKHTSIKFGAFVVFCFAQSFSPIVYGLRNKELKDKICIRQERSQYSNYLVNNNTIPPEVSITECSADRNAIAQSTTEGPPRQ